MSKSNFLLSTFYLSCVALAKRDFIPPWRDKITTKPRGFTLVEMLVGVAVFIMVSIAIYSTYIGLFKIIDLGQYRVLATSLANEKFEIARNMPYEDVGVQGSIPSGKLIHKEDITRGGVGFTVTTIVRNLDLPFDGTIGGTPNDLSPADNKLIEVTVSCVVEGGCRGLLPITLAGQVAPKNLETASTNGALFIRVFDASGQPVQGASVNVTNVSTTTTININDTTDANGMLQLVDVPPGVNAYRITVTKQGYSTDKTYPPNVEPNPSPIKPDATVVLQQVTQISFAIDRLSTMNLSSVTPSCSPVGNVGFAMVGSKPISVNVTPTIFKYSKASITNSSGLLTLSAMEWDAYTVYSNDPSYDIAGLSPLNPISLNPDSTQNVKIIVTSKTSRSLLVTVKDNASQLPIEGALVRLVGPSGYEQSLVTGRGHLTQTDWSLGSGQASFIDPAKYWNDNGSVDISSLGELTLKNVFGSYNPLGILESSYFDTGSTANFHSLIWSPTDQPLTVGADSVRFQLASTATVTATTTWDFKGPDGTAGTYYSSSNSPINNIHSGDRYMKYRAYLSTADDTVTPNVSDVSFTYTSDCVPPGQVIFTSLPTSGTYTLTVSRDGYVDSIVDAIVPASGWLEKQVFLEP